MKDIKGVTLVELLVGMAVGMLLLGSIYMAVNVAQRSTSGIERKVTAQQDLKPALDLMATEIGMASYNPNYATGLWLNPATCAAATATNQTYKGIQEATANSITVEMDITNMPDGSGNCSGTDGDGAIGGCNEIIRYAYLTGTTDILCITRQTISCASGAPTTFGAQSFLGATTADVASGNPRTVRVINDLNSNGVYDAGTDIPVFRYYNGTGQCILETGEIAFGNCIGNVHSSTLPGAIRDIRRIEITLVVETEDRDPNTQQRRRLIYSTSVIPRNHVIIP